MGKTPLSLHELIKRPTQATMKVLSVSIMIRSPVNDFLLLNEDGTTSREPYLEVVDKYPASSSFSDACEAAGLDSSLAKRLSTIIFGKDVNLRQHQAEALKASFSKDGVHNTVVTSGTGSGKTESFLLPILARILNESNDILEPPISKWWEKEDKE